MKNKKQIIAVCIIAAAVILAAVAFIVLPETLVMQIDTAGNASSTMPKIVGVLIPFLFTVIFTLLYLKRENDRRSFWLALLGIVLFALVFIFNL